MVKIHSGILFSHKKKEILVQTTWMKLEDIMQVKSVRERHTQLAQWAVWADSSTLNRSLCTSWRWDYEKTFMSYPHTSVFVSIFLQQNLTTVVIHQKNKNANLRKQRFLKEYLNTWEDAYDTLSSKNCTSWSILYYLSFVYVHSFARENVWEEIWQSIHSGYSWVMGFWMILFFVLSFSIFHVFYKCFYNYIMLS